MSATYPDSRPRLVVGQGTWCRTRSYFDRAEWSGRRWLRDRPVADGVATNALAHAVAQSLRIAGVTAIGQIASITTELYTANTDNQADDTSWLRVDATDRPPVSCALTLCGPGGNPPPRVDLICDRGTLGLEYTRDRLLISDQHNTRTEVYDRTDLLENLVDHLSRGTALCSPLTAAGPYMAVLQAIQDAVPAPLTGGVTIDGQGMDAHPVVDDIQHWIDQAAVSGLGFAASGAPWADPATVSVWHPDGVGSVPPERRIPCTPSR